MRGISVDHAHVLLDALGALESNMDAGRKPWSEYDEDAFDPKAFEASYVHLVSEARAMLSLRIAHEHMTPETAAPKVTIVTRLRNLGVFKAWPIALFLAVVIGLWGAYGKGAQSVNQGPCPSTQPAVLYLPADPNMCPEEDSCAIDYADGLWTVRKVVP